MLTLKNNCFLVIKTLLPFILTFFVWWQRKQLSLSSEWERTTFPLFDSCVWLYVGACNFGGQYIIQLCCISSLYQMEVSITLKRKTNNTMWRISTFILIVFKQRRAFDLLSCLSWNKVYRGANWTNQIVFHENFVLCSKILPDIFIFWKLTNDLNCPKWGF